MKERAMRYLGLFALAVGCTQEEPGRSLGAGAPEELATDESELETADEAVLLQALVTDGSTDCPAHIVEVQPGADIFVDWSGVTVDVLGEPVDGDLADGSATLHPYVDVATDEVLAACGVLPREEVGPMVYLQGDDGATRTVPGADLPDVGGIAALHMVSHGQFVFLAFLLPQEDSVTTSLVVR
jgi:hypothetical protein